MTSAFISEMRDDVCVLVTCSHQIPLWKKSCRVHFTNLEALETNGTNTLPPLACVGCGCDRCDGAPARPKC